MREGGRIRRRDVSGGVAVILDEESVTTATQSLPFSFRVHRQACQPSKATLASFWAHGASPELPPLRLGWTKEGGYHVAASPQPSPELATKPPQTRDYTLRICRSPLLTTLIGLPLSAER